MSGGLGQRRASGGSCLDIGASGGMLERQSLAPRLNRQQCPSSRGAAGLGVANGARVVRRHPALYERARAVPATAAAGAGPGLELDFLERRRTGAHGALDVAIGNSAADTNDHAAMISENDSQPQRPDGTGEIGSKERFSRRRGRRAGR